MAKASPPMPVDIGSVTPSMAAAAIAASTALPPRSSMRIPARVAVGWLVDTIARAATTGGRAGAQRNRPGAGEVTDRRPRGRATGSPAALTHDVEQRLGARPTGELVPGQLGSPAVASGRITRDVGRHRQQPG